MLNRHITDEANARLRYYISDPPESQLLPEAPSKPQLPPNTVDAPLVRVFNFLRGFNSSHSCRTSPQKVSRVHVSCIPIRNPLLSGRKDANPWMGRIPDSRNGSHPEIFQGFILDVCFPYLFACSIPLTCSLAGNNYP